MRIDLHTHSTASDGTDAPDALMRHAAGAGLDVIALTDHDTTAGWARAASAVPPGLTLVPGAELSGRWYRDEPTIGLHLLAYLFDPGHPGLTAELAAVRRSRDRRAEAIVEMLNADGIDLTMDEVRALVAGGTAGRPHVARALVARGLVGSVDEAFAPEWLGGRYRLPKTDIDVLTAIRLIGEAGGVAVLAHPMAGSRGHVLPDALIAGLADAGLWGVEADHVDHAPGDAAHVRALARELGLRVTGSSDYHGDNKTVRLGAFTTGREVYEDLLSAATGAVPVQGPPR
ncbi:phosphatase [Sphaerisporangium siamense]|uniref:Putative metal-dependent phosphoesterase TrpH n=1 Tax=Sphaerisporangium siamense TaxID=795645 RepID=A0A7W7GD19_9ACTN|nr:PHP domain-containing protein [Sphaerisporangium siamense]MBB4705142.1 putative metal-dependent phosphoesterase TrpH [Sphaerisporangium siamense]GII83949.1 phosphatase [Sphaerisporangium siamense]